MARKKQSRGTCLYCGLEATKSGITKHLPICPVRLDAIAKANEGKGDLEALFHLRVQSADSNDFWLDLEVRGTATLKAIDTYLRAIWLECCSHMSEFAFGKGWGDQIGMSRKVQNVFAPEVLMTHIYDFGSSSETWLTCVSVRTGKPLTSKPIVLLARNILPESVCIECGNPATHLCMECLYEDQTEGALCEECVEEHPHDNYGEPIPLVNSPRMGVCGYDGPAVPPY